MVTGYNLFMSSRPFSKRDKPKSDILKYDIPHRVRNRILHILYALADRFQGEMTMTLEDAARKCLQETGELHEKQNSIPRRRNKSNRALEHFLTCPDEQVIDFIEWCFQSEGYRAKQDGVDAINRVFREEGIGYEFSPYVILSTRMGGDAYGGITQYHKVQFPEATKKSSEVLHATTIMPCLHLLGRPAFKTANSEMLHAHEQFRKGHFDAAINACGQAFESVLKTICTKKKWRYDRNKDGLAKLIEICSAHKLFPSFYTEIFKASGIIRNKFGSHGKGPRPLHGVAGVGHADHMIQQTSAHILLIMRLAKL